MLAKAGKHGKVRGESFGPGPDAGREGGRVEDAQGRLSYRTSQLAGHRCAPSPPPVPVPSEKASEPCFLSMSYHRGLKIV